MMWLFLMVAFWVAIGVASRHMCSRAGWEAYEQRKLRAARAGHWHPDAVKATREMSPELLWPGGRKGRTQRTRVSARASELEETPEERIRRRFVEGRIDLDRYEAELWEELRPK
jgi:hypothetical protein